MQPRVGRIRISLDFELGWGVAQGGGWREAERKGVYRNLRPVLSRFIKRLDELELSFLWAVVGGMVDEPSQRNISHLKGKFAEDLSLFIKEADEKTIDGRDLLDMVTGMHTPQSFGTHTYSHLLFSDPEQDANVIRSDLDRALSVNKRLGIGASRLVFPRNHSGYLHVTAAAGVTHVRMPAVNTPDPTKRPGSVSRAISLALRSISPVEEIRHDSGLVLHCASELLNWGANASAIKRSLIQKRVKKAMQMAKSGKDVHFWFHPFDLVQTKGLELDVHTLLFEIAKLRDSGRVRVGGF